MSNQPLDQSIDILSQALKTLAENKATAGDLTDINFLNFKADKGEVNYGKGVIFSGHGSTKQFILVQNPDRFFSSESIDLAQNSSIMVNRMKVLDAQELGPTVTKSNLQEVGRLKGLIVDGSLSVNNYLYFDKNNDRLGLGTEAPNAALSVLDGTVETMIGTNEYGHGFIGTHASHDFDIVAGSKIWLTVKSHGAIDLGNPRSNTSSVRVHGKLSVGVEVPDASVDLHVAGPVRLNNKLHIYAETPPTAGNYSLGDIVWHSTPRPGGNIGWVCTKAGSPGTWHRFGDIR
jgi:hypothetical protein